MKANTWLSVKKSRLACYGFLNLLPHEPFSTSPVVYQYPKNRVDWQTLLAFQGVLMKTEAAPEPYD